MFFVKFYVNLLDVTVDVLEELDLSYLRSTGKQPHEEEQPASEEDGQVQGIVTDERSFSSSLFLTVAPYVVDYNYTGLGHYQLQSVGSRPLSQSN